MLNALNFFQSSKSGRLIDSGGLLTNGREGAIAAVVTRR